MEKQLLYEETGKLPEVFSNEDIERIKETIEKMPYPKNMYGKFLKERNKAIFLTLFILALRPKEACCLKFNDFDMERKVIKIRAENNKQGKSREIPCPNLLIEAYKSYLKFNRPIFWKGSDYLFPSMENDHISAGRWKHIFRNVLKNCGLWLPPEHPETGNKTPPLRSYTLRHTKATQLLNKSKDIFLVSNILGHSKLNSTKVYLHKSEEYMNYMRDFL